MLLAVRWMRIQPAHGNSGGGDDDDFFFFSGEYDDDDCKESGRSHC